MNTVYETLYHTDSKGKTRIWYITQEGEKYKATAGILGGKLVTAEWTIALPKNEGKANATTGIEQATKEIEALYLKKLESKYSRGLENATYRKFNQPMLAKSYSAKVVDKYGVEYVAVQPKLDGIRAIFAAHQKGMSRAGKPFETTVHIEAALAEILKHYNIELDGELYNHDYSDKFEELTSFINTKKVEKLTAEVMSLIKNTVQFHIYDIRLLDKPEASFAERHEILTDIYKKHLATDNRIELVATAYVRKDPAVINDNHDTAFTAGYEGLMVRNPKAPYYAGRTNDLLKVKNFEDAEMIIEEVVEGTGNWAGAAKSVVVRTPKGTLSSTGIKGSKPFCEQLLRDAEKLKGTEVTVNFQNYTADDALRFGICKKFHYGKREN